MGVLEHAAKIVTRTTSMSDEARMSSANASRERRAGRVLLVLGCPANPDGSPRPPLARRLGRALELHRRFDRAPLVVSGGKVHGPVEAETMARWLVERGVPEALLRLEREARSTIDNVRLSLPLIELNATIHLVTEQFHMRRARILTERLARRPVVPEPVDDALRGWKRVHTAALERIKLARDLATLRTG